ncbi:integrase arm-type DNA-binding domain-containing protein [Acinetobacter sp. BSP-28]|uniref:integrase arm-type DNA-binding domain-containing protein n=1 Tax=Acinetobacter sp. BSP-28 TaxID=3344661 RepID=UPI003770053B
MEKSIKVSDGDGLYLLLDKKGGTYWRFDYVRPISKKRSTIALGVYPEVTLADARVKRAEFRKLISQNIDPSEIKIKEKEQALFAADNTFKFIAEEFRKTEELESSTQKRNAFVWEKLYLSIGKYPISEITAAQILDACRLYEKQGKTDSARRMRSKDLQVFHYTIALGLWSYRSMVIRSLRWISRMA